MATHTVMTAEQFDQLPEQEGRSYELLDGKLIEMAPANLEHNGILEVLMSDAGWYLREHRLGRAFPDTELAIGGDRFRPDIAILFRTSLSK